MAKSNQPPKLCDACRSIADTYLIIARGQEEVLRVIVDLSLGIESDDGLDKLALSRLGGLLRDFLIRRTTLNHYVLGGEESQQRA